MGQNRWVQIDRSVQIGQILSDKVQNQPKNGPKESGSTWSPGLVFKVVSIE